MEINVDFFGYIGAFLLAGCGAPEAYLAWKRKRSDLSWTFLSMWGGGEVLLFIPMLFKYQISFLLANYILNILFITVIGYYKYRGDKNV